MQARVITSPSRLWWSPLGSYLVELVFCGIILFLITEFGLTFAQINPQVTAVMPASGVALALFLWRGYRIWPAAWLTGILTRYFINHGFGQAIDYFDFGQAILFASGAVTQAIAGAWLVRHFVGKKVDFGSIRGVLGFLWWGAIVRAAMSATWGVEFLLWRGQLDPDQMQLAWLTWFVGSSMGVAVFGSFVLCWVQPTTRREGEASLSETLLIFMLLAVVTWLDFLSELPLTFLPFPFLIWAGLRLDARALTTAVVIVVVTSLSLTRAGYHAFGLINEDVNQLLIVMQVFIVCVAGSGLVLGAVASDRRRTLRATAKLSSFQRAVLDGSNFSIVVCDDHGIITSVNRGAERLLGYSAKELLGHKPTMFHDPEEIAARARELSARTGRRIEGFETFVHFPRAGTPDEREWIFIRKDGSRFPVFISVTPVQPVGGKVQGFMSVAVDITERKQAEEQMRAAQLAAEQANRAKSEFLANISHEIRTPMNSILGFSELLQRHLTDPGMRKQAQSIVSSGKTLLQLINDLLDLSKVEAGRLEIQPSPMNLRELITEVRQFFALKADEKDLALLAQFAGPVEGQFLLDEVRLRQILFNLLGNALKFTDHGQVVLAVEVKADETPGQCLLHFEVRDTGIGMTAEQLARIFIPFEQRAGQSTRKYGGTGLGLSISRRLAELMGGTLIASSQPGSGSVFRLTIPHIARSIATTAIVASAEITRPSAQTVAANGSIPRGKPAILTPAALAALRHCAKLAGGSWTTAWKKLLQAPLFEDVERFANGLANAAGAETPDYVRDFGRRLAEQARDYEVEEMMQSLREFPALAVRLQGEADADIRQPA